MDRNKHIAHTILAISLCFLLVYSLADPALRAYAVETDAAKSAPPAAILAEPGVAVTESEQPSSPPEPEVKDPGLSSDQEASDASAEPTAKDPEIEALPSDGLPLVSIEDEYTVTYAEPDGGYSTWFSDTRQAYKDKDGTLKLFDNNLEKHDPPLSAPYYENADADFTATFPDEITDTRGVSLEKGSDRVEMVPMAGDFSRSKTKANAIRYTEAEPGVDYQYTLSGDTIKEDIILNQYIDTPSFDFELKTGRLSAVLENNIVYLYAKGNDKPVFALSAPSMVDASGKTSSDIQQTLRQESGKTILTVTPDHTWLSDLSRAYPVKIDPTVRINDGLLQVRMVCSASGSSHDINSEWYGGGLVGFDDGVLSGSDPWPFGYTRIYIKANYNFSLIPSDATIDSATFSLFQTTAHSNGQSRFQLYEVNQDWNPSTITWVDKPTDFTYINVQNANATPNTSITWTNVGETVNGWFRGLKPNYGFVVMGYPEISTTQCEDFRTWTAVQNSKNPTLVINWHVPGPVPDRDVSDITIGLRPITEKAVSGKLKFDGVFADGLAKPGSDVGYRLLPDNTTGQAPASYSYKYPDSSAWTDAGKIYPTGTRYLDLVSNWQTTLYNNPDLALDKKYTIAAKATYKDIDMYDPDITGAEKQSEPFLIYKSKQFDTIPNIAKHYGVPLDTVMRDNRVNDTLIMENNTVFIRNPKNTSPYNPAPLTDASKREIDSALMGRGYHCEFGFEPVNMSTGNFYMEQKDATIPEIGDDFSILRSYNSIGDSYQSAFGPRWNFEYAESLAMTADGSVIYTMGDGKHLYFHPDGAGGYTSPAGYYLDLKQIPYTINVEGEDEVHYNFEMTSTDGSVKKFNSWGLLAETVNAEGLKTTISYDANYNIKSVTSPTGKVYTFTSDGFGRITAITQPDGGVMSYEYDDAGNLVKYTDVTGGVTQYVYDESSHMTEWYDPNGHRVAENIYNSEGRVTEQVDADGNKIAIAYTDIAVTSTDAEGNVTVYTLDDQKRPTEIEYADGEAPLREYDAANMLTRDDDMRYEYDDRGNKTKEIRADGSSKAYEYNADNLLTKVTDYDGLTTEYEYNAGKDLIKTTRADGAAMQTAYDAYHRPVSTMAIDGTTNTDTYDGAVVTSTTDAMGNVWKYGYDAMNRRVSSSDPLGNITCTTYDKAGRVISEQAADGGLVTFERDKAGSATSITDARGYKTTAVLSPMNKIMKATDPLGDTIYFTYDNNGNLSTETDPLGNITHYTYDPKNRVAKTEGPAGAFTEYTYDEKGRLASVKNERGAASYYTYDEILGAPVSIENQNGNKTTYSYDAVGRLLSVTNPDGTKETYEYLPSGLQSAVMDAQGLKTTYTYAGNDYMATSTENGSRTYSYEYNALGSVTKSTDPLGNATTYEYDKLSRLTKQIDPRGAEATYEYDPAGRLTKQTDANGGVTLREYDKAGNLLRETDANSGTTEYIYDEICRVTSEKDAMGSVTNYAYDAGSNLISATDALGGKKTFTYGPLNLPTGVTDENGNTTKMEYDAAGNQLKIILANGDTSETVYDALSRQISQTDALGTRTDWTYDNMGRTAKKTDTLGDLLNYTYDEYGRLAKTTDELGRTEENSYNGFSEITQNKTFDGDVTKMEYDALGRTVKTTYADGSYTSAAFDAAGNLASERQKNSGVYTYVHDLKGNLLSTTDPLDGITSYTYDALGNQTTMTDANGAATTYAYDALSRLTASKSALGNEQSYTYDALSRPISVVTPGGGQWQYRYDPAGNTVQVIDPMGDITGYTYNNIYQRTGETSPMGGEIAYTYDALGHKLSETDALGNTTEYTVKPDGLVSSMKQPTGGVTTYTYDQAERITSVTSPLGLTRAFSYDKYGNLASEKDNLGRTSTYSYDVMHDLIGEVNPDNVKTSMSYDTSGSLTSLTAGNGGVTSYTYDLLNRMTKTTNALGETTGLTYDKMGNLTGYTLPGGRTWKFGYDAEGRAISANDPLGYSTSTAYDGGGNVTADTNALGKTTGYVYDLADRLTTVTDSKGAVTSLTYDRNSNMTGVTDSMHGKTTYGYDLADNLTSVTDPNGRLTSYAYDGLYNLTQVTDAEGRVTSYGYDPAGNLTSITNPAGEVRTFSYDIAGRVKKASSPSGDTVSYDYDKLDALVSKDYKEDNRQNTVYIYDAMGNRVSMDDVGGKAAYEYDLLNRITKITDEEGHVTKYVYGANSQVSSITYADGSVVKYGYDKNDNLTSVTDENGTAKYVYDTLGRPVSLIRSDGIKTTYAYDENGNLTALKNTAKDGAVISAFAYEYDALGRIEKETETGSVGGTATRTFAYSSSGELVTFNESTDGGKVKYEYSYDQAGNRISQKKTGAGENETIVYLYDKAGRIASETSSLTGKTTYKYDKDGNLIEKSGMDTQTTYEYTVENRLKAVREGGRLLMAASYDGDGNRILQINLRTKNSSRPDTEEQELKARRAADKAEEDAAKFITDENTPKAAPNQDGGNPLIRVLSYLKALFMPLMPYTLKELTTDPLPGSGTGAGGALGWIRETALSAQTPNEKRISAMDLKADEESAIQNAHIPDVYTGYRYEDTYELTRYVNDTNRGNAEVLMEYMENGNLKTKYTYGLDRLSTSNAAASGARGETVSASYIPSGRGSVSALISQVTGGLLTSYSYDSYGNTTAIAYNKSGAAASYTIEETFYGYNSESYDPLTSLQYLRARYYDPQAGRFGVADTYLGELIDPLSLNLYAYTENDPINRIDPSGHAMQAEAVYQSYIYLVRILSNDGTKLNAAVCLVKIGNFAYARSAYKADITLVGKYIQMHSFNRGTYYIRQNYNQYGSDIESEVTQQTISPMPPTSVSDSVDPRQQDIDKVRNPQNYPWEEVAAAKGRLGAQAAELSANINQPSCSAETDKISTVDAGGTRTLPSGVVISEYYPDTNLSGVDQRIILKLGKMAVARHCTFYITSGYRSVDEQNDMHANKGSNPDPVAQGGYSWHNYGGAVDVSKTNYGSNDYAQYSLWVYKEPLCDHVQYKENSTTYVDKSIGRAYQNRITTWG